MSDIVLIPRTLMNLLSAVYEEEDNLMRFDLVRNLLDPYVITFDQVKMVIDTIFWPGRLHASAKHPSYAILKQLDAYLTHDGQAMVPAETLKKHFVFACVSICHAWYTKQRENDGRFILHKKPHFVAYQEPGLAVPFIWFSIDDHGMTHVMQMDPRVPPLEIRLFRSTKNGDLFPLTFYPRLQDQDEKNMERVELEVCIYDSKFLNLDIRRNANQDNFVVFMSENLTLVRCLLVSPSVEKTWSVPCILHKYE